MRSTTPTDTAARPTPDVLPGTVTTPDPAARSKRSPGSLAPDHELMLRVATMPSDVNGNGDVFGGWVMAQVDVAGGVAAARRARGRVATVAVTDFLFKQPISVGDVVSFYTRIERVGRTSITVHVEVFAERNPADPVTVKVTEAVVTYVAIDTGGRKREVPPSEA